MKTRTQLIALLIIATHVLLVGWGATKQSPTFNEPAHLVSGISHWTFGRFELYRVNPPLVRMIATIPILGLNFKTNWSKFYEAPGARPASSVGKDFIAANRELTPWIFSVCRWSCLPFTILGAVVCLQWSRELYGEKAGIITLSLWCFSPNILAHSQLITPDIGASALGVTAAYTFWKWLMNKNWFWAVVSGGALGLAELTKTSWILLYGIFPSLWFYWIFTDRALPFSFREYSKQIFQLLSVLLISIYILNLFYIFDGTFSKLGDFEFVSKTLSGKTIPKNSESFGNIFNKTWLENVPIPLPKQYLLGIDIQKRDFENFGKPSFLNGQFREYGWWYYYLYALTIKVPIGTLLLLGSSVISIFLKNSHFKGSEVVLLAPAIALLILVSSQTGFNHHMRYVLPFFPFMFIWIGRLGLFMTKQKWLTAFYISFLLIYSITSSLRYFPHSLSYFNELGGGPVRGHEHLINSNIDWGQDLFYLKDWIDNNPEKKPIHLAYYGYLNPIHLGVEYVPAKYLISKSDTNSHSRKLSTDELTPGWYAISVNFIKGTPWFVPLPKGEEGFAPQGAYSYFQHLTPRARVGYSIYLYEIDHADLKKIKELVSLQNKVYHQHEY